VLPHAPKTNKSQPISLISHAKPVAKYQEISCSDEAKAASSKAAQLA